jgi:hypothetical protein
MNTKEFYEADQFDGLLKLLDDISLSFSFKKFIHFFFISSLLIDFGILSVLFLIISFTFIISLAKISLLFLTIFNSFDKKSLLSSNSFVYTNNKRGSPNLIDFFNLSVTTQAGVGLTNITPNTEIAILISSLQQLSMIAKNIVMLYFFTRL